MDKMNFTAIGKLADNCWQELPKHFPNIKLGSFMVMPNHVHGIVVINSLPHDIQVQKRRPSPQQGHALSLQMAAISPKSGSLAAIIGSYKSAVSKSAHLVNPKFA